VKTALACRKALAGLANTNDQRSGLHDSGRRSRRAPPDTPSATVAGDRGFEILLLRQFNELRKSKSPDRGSSHIQGTTLGHCEPHHHAKLSRWSEGPKGATAQLMNLAGIPAKLLSLDDIDFGIMSTAPL
jgi:hypothetical protein